MFGAIKGIFTVTSQRRSVRVHTEKRGNVWCLRVIQPPSVLLHTIQRQTRELMLLFNILAEKYFHLF